MSSALPDIRIVDIVDLASFGLVPPCADPGFDHRTCDYWEDADRGSKRARPAWLQPGGSGPPGGAQRPALFGYDDAVPPVGAPLENPFARPAAASSQPFNPLLEKDEAVVDNPFAPPPRPRRLAGSDVPRKLGLLGRGLIAFGSYAKVLLVEDE